MRIGILANSLPAARHIYDEAKPAAGGDLFVLLCPTHGRSPAPDLVRHFARLILKTGRWKSLRMMAAGKIVRLAKPLDDSETVAQLAAMRFDIGLHKSGNIYREATIECFRLGILNAHIGLLPKYRGRSVMEWSLLQGDPVGISVFFVDEGIDTGQRIVMSETVDVSHCKSISEAKEYLFGLDGQFYRAAIERLQAEETTYQENDGSGRRYYVMSRLFQGVAEKCLAARPSTS